MSIGAARIALGSAVGAFALAAGMAVAVSGAADPAITARPAPECDPLALAQAHALWRAGQYREADAAFCAAIGADSSCAGALWGAAMARLDVALDQPDDRVRRPLLLAAVQMARRAVANAPHDTWAHLYLGAALGRLALTEGPGRKLELARAVKQQADLALAADSTNARAHHLLARWHREVAGLGVLTRAAATVVYGGVPAGASLEQALAHFERALALEPQRINHHLEYARTLAQAGRTDAALDELRRIVNLPDAEPRDPQYRAEALALRRQLLAGRKRKEHGLGDDR